jgi:hypothetical protein
MAIGRAPIVVGIVVIAGGIAWFAMRDSRPASGPAPGSGGLTAGGSGSGSGKAAISAPQGPSLGGSGGNAFDPSYPGPAPALPDAMAIGAPSHRDVFAAQTRDPAWSTSTEDDLKAMVGKLKLTTVESVECHTDQCELTLVGPAGDVDATVAKLEGPKGLPKLAKSMLLGGPERNGDTLTLRVYAMFER